VVLTAPITHIVAAFSTLPARWEAGASSKPGLWEHLARVMPAPQSCPHGPRGGEHRVLQFLHTALVKEEKLVMIELVLTLSWG